MKKILTTFALILLPGIGFAQQNTPECEALWYERNLIFSQGGLCYRSTLGKALFDNSTCTLQRGGDVFLTAPQRDTISNILAQERALSCRINTSQAPSADLMHALQTETETPQATDTTPQTQNAAHTTCSPDPIIVWKTPEQQDMAGILSSQEPVQTPPTDPNWHQITVEKYGWDTQDVWIDVAMIAETCTHNNQHQPILFAPHTFDETYGAPGLNNAIVTTQPDTPTGRANQLWSKFKWSHTGCGPLPTIALNIDNMMATRSQIQRYRTCVSEQAQKDEIDFIVAVTELGGKSITTPRMNTQTVYPWDCLTCQAHHHSLEQAKQQRSRWREDTNVLLDEIDDTLKAWLNYQ